MSHEVTESALVHAVARDLTEKIPGWSAHEIFFEINDIWMPPITGQRALVVWTGGFQPTGAHQTSGTVRDLSFGVNVSVAVKLSHIPRDRWDEWLYALEDSDTLNPIMAKVIDVVDWSYDLMGVANEIIEEKEGTSQQGFFHPLVFAGPGVPEIRDSRTFGVSGDNVTYGLLRRVQFGSARRIVTL